MKGEKKLKELLTEYGESKSISNEADKSQKEIRQEVAKILHENKVNFVVIEDQYGTFWKPQYNKVKRTKIDYELLSKSLSKELYNEIVQKEEHDQFKIAKASKKDIQQTDLTEQAPVKQPSNEDDLPTGELG